MAFYEQEFIEIKREKAKMEIIGTMKCSVEQEDVRRYLASRKPKEKCRMSAFGALTALVWLLAALPAVAALFLTNNPNPRLGGGTLALTVIFALIAIICTVCYVRIFSATEGFFALNTRQPLECRYQLCVLTSRPVWSPAWPPWALPFSSILALPIFTAILKSSLI